MLVSFSICDNTLIKEKSGFIILFSAKLISIKALPIQSTEMIRAFCIRLLQIHLIGNESGVPIYPLSFTNTIDIFHNNSNNMHYFPHYLPLRLYNPPSYASESSLLFDILVKAIILLNLRTNFACFQKFSHGYIDFFVRLFLFTKNAIIVIRVKPLNVYIVLSIL